MDVFCAGLSFHADGLLMVAGGTLSAPDSNGTPYALMFDPGTQQWVTKPQMNSGRWYPTLLTLGNGNIFTISGIDQNGMLNVQPELYSDANGWNIYPPTTSPIPMYAHLFLLRDGRIFFSGAYMGYSNGVTPRILTLPSTFTQAITETPVPGLPQTGSCNQAASVLLPPAQDQKVMVIGGGTDSSNSTMTSVNTTAIVDLTATNPTYTRAAPLKYARMHHLAVLLPDRTVFVCNGSKMGEDTSTSALPAEIYDPNKNTWTAVETQTVPRVYHSVAWLLPDGRVATAGGQPQTLSPELRLEIYSPSYMSQPRPVIQSAPQSVSYGGTLTVQTPQASNIKWISLIKPMANTHCYDTEQRLVDVPITARTQTSLTGPVTSNPNLAPPGWYMLFITGKNTVPSVATWIQLH